MPVIEVWCLPRQTQDQLRDLHKAIVNAVVSIEVLGLRDETQMTTLFPLDAMRYGLGTDIIVKVYGLDKKPERTLDVRRQLSGNLGRAVSSFFPKAKIECFVDEFDHAKGAFWMTDGFQNPFGQFCHNGPFTMRLDWDGYRCNSVPTIKFEGDTLTAGIDSKDSCSVTFFPHEQEFVIESGDAQVSLEVSRILDIRRMDGSLVWRNPRYP